MCGINAIYHIKHLNNPQEIISKMNQASEHRGPDYSGTYVDEDVALGHNRLSIIDLDEGSHQPFKNNEENVILIFNGEVYNFEYLKTVLKDYDYKTEGDTEVVMAAYLKWGISCLNHFNGMFAFTIWDKRNNTFFVARDRMGIKPLYYNETSKHFVLSSEIRSLLASGLVSKKINPAGVVDYLEYGTVHAPRTMVKDVKMLLPGHYIKIDSDGLSEHKYWDINLHHSTESTNKTYEEVSNTVKSKFLNSVELRLKSDVAFGAFLSGGIDSSAVVGAMASVSDRPVETFNIAFNEAEFSEAKYAKIIADKWNTNHHEIKLKPSDFLNHLPSALKSMDHPSLDGPNSYLVSKVTKEAGVTMALSGLGGDELFAGYDIFKRAYSLINKKWLISFPLGLRKLGGYSLRKLKPSIASDKIAKTITAKYMELPYFYPINRQLMFRDEIEEITYNIAMPENAVKEILQHGIGIKSNGTNAHFLSQVSYAEINTYMQNTLLRDTDQMSMAHALEVRVPFLDHELVEYVYGIKDEYKYPTTPKKLLVDSLKEFLPDEIVNRPKMGFTFPWEQWLKNELKDYSKEGIDVLKNTSIFKEDALEKLQTSFYAGHYKSTWSKIWLLSVLGHWIKENDLETA